MGQVAFVLLALKRKMRLHLWVGAERVDVIGKFAPWAQSVCTEGALGDAILSRVEVDEDTGAVRLLRYVSAADPGKAINPKQVEGQDEGAAMQAIGHTMFEEMLFEDGQFLNPNLVDYRVPTFTDLPDEFETVLIEFGDGFACVTQRGSEHRDEMTPEGFAKNSSGGTLGGWGWWGGGRIVRPWSAISW